MRVTLRMTAARRGDAMPECVRKIDLRPTTGDNVTPTPQLRVRQTRRRRERHADPSTWARVTSHSIIVQDRADAAVLGEQRIAAEPEQVEVERLIGLLLAVAFDFDGDRLRRLAGGEDQCAGLGDVVVVARLGGAWCGRIWSTQAILELRRTQVRDLVLGAREEPVAAGTAGEQIRVVVVEDGGVAAAGLQEIVVIGPRSAAVPAQVVEAGFVAAGRSPFGHHGRQGRVVGVEGRSEERRVGKECRL